MSYNFQEMDRALNFCISFSKGVHLMEDAEMNQILRQNYEIDAFDPDLMQAIAERLC